MSSSRGESSTYPAPGPDFLLHPTPVDSRPDTATDGREAASFPQHYPEMLQGEDFMEQVRLRMSGCRRFAAVALRAEPVEPADGHLLRIAAAVDGVCRRQGGFWGLPECERFGCLLPEQDLQGGRGLVDAVRERLSADGGAGMWAGIAVFPTHDFGCGEIVPNALKALDHAVFFGSGGTAVFDAVSLNISGDRRYQAGDIAGAMAEFRRGLALDPRDVNLLNSLGVCHGNEGEYESALECFQEAGRLDPQEVMAIYNTGLTLMLLGRQRQAGDYFLRAGELEPDRYEVALQAGRVWLDQGEVERARGLLEKAAEQAPDNALAYRLLGDCFAATDRTREALDAYRRAVRNNPNDPESLSALGCLYDVLGENAQIATVMCRQSVEIAPRNGLFRKRLASLHRKQDRLIEALEEYEAADALGCSCGREIEDLRRRMEGREAADGS